MRGLSGLLRLAGRANGKGGGLLLDTHYPHGAGRVDFAQRSTWAISANEETDAEAGVLDVKIQADTVNTGSGMKNGKLKGIYPTLLKSALFAVVLACFKILEDAAIGRYHGRSFHQSIAELGGGTWTGTLTLTLLLFVVLIPFVGFRELQRVFGAEKLALVFFHQHVLEN